MNMFPQQSVTSRAWGYLLKWDTAEAELSTIVQYRLNQTPSPNPKTLKPNLGFRAADYGLGLGIRV